MRFVLDASVAVRWFVSEEAHPHADAVLERLLEAPELFAVPELFYYEVHAVLARVRPDHASVYADGFLPATQAGGGKVSWPIQATFGFLAATLCPPG